MPLPGSDAAEVKDRRACVGDSVGVLGDEELVVASVVRLVQGGRVQADLHSGIA